MCLHGDTGTCSMTHMLSNHCLSQECNVETIRYIACNRVCAMRHMFMHSLYVAHVARHMCHATCFSVIYMIFICDTSRNHLCSRNAVSSLLDILLATNYASCKISFGCKTRRHMLHRTCNMQHLCDMQHVVTVLQVTCLFAGK